MEKDTFNILGPKVCTVKPLSRLELEQIVIELKDKFGYEWDFEWIENGGFNVIMWRGKLSPRSYKRFLLPAEWTFCSSNCEYVLDKPMPKQYCQLEHGFGAPSWSIDEIDTLTNVLQNHQFMVMYSRSPSPSIK